MKSYQHHSGLSIRIDKQGDNRFAMIWSGTSTWQHDFDPENVLYNFVEAFELLVPPPTHVDIHIEDFRWSNSSTITAVAEIVGPLVERGNTVQLFYDPKLLFQWDLVESMKKAVVDHPDPGVRERCSFEPKEGAPLPTKPETPHAQ